MLTQHLYILQIPAPLSLRPHRFHYHHQGLSKLHVSFDIIIVIIYKSRFFEIRGPFTEDRPCGSCVARISFQEPSEGYGVCPHLLPIDNQAPSGNDCFEGHASRPIGTLTRLSCCPGIIKLFLDKPRNGFEPFEVHSQQRCCHRYASGRFVDERADRHRGKKFSVCVTTTSLEHPKQVIPVPTCESLSENSVPHLPSILFLDSFSSCSQDASLSPLFLQPLSLPQ